MRWCCVGVILLWLVALSAAGCDRKSPSSATALPASAPVLELDLRPLTPLLPGRATHLAVDSSGNLYWAQESDAGDDTMFVMGTDGIPRATMLSSTLIGRALGGGDDSHGNLQSLCAGPDGQVFFYFRGESGGRLLAGLGSYDPGGSRIGILAGTAALEAATSMGRSLALASGALAGGPRGVWLRVHHTDAGCVFRFDPRQIAPDSPVALRKAFESIRLGESSISLTHDDDPIAVADDSHLFWLDAGGGRLLRVDAGGRAEEVMTLAGLPGALSLPVVDRKGRIMFFAADAPPRKPNPTDTKTRSSKLDVVWPAMLIFESDGSVTSIPRDNIQAYPGFPVFGMKLKELIPGPKGDVESWIGYDGNSGEVLRLTIKERPWS